jgi:putative oxidoreductase
MTIGLFVLRTAVAVALLGQAGSKLRLDGRARTTAYFRSIGFEPAGALALLTGMVELGAGLLLLGGLATPVAVAAAGGVLVNAAAVSGSNGWAAAKGGAEYPATLGVVTAALAFTGPGGASIDALLGWDDVPAGVALGALATALGAAAPFLALRHRHHALALRVTAA